MKPFRTHDNDVPTVTRATVNVRSDRAHIQGPKGKALCGRPFKALTAAQRARLTPCFACAKRARKQR